MPHAKKKKKNNRCDEFQTLHQVLKCTKQPYIINALFFS